MDTQKIGDFLKVLTPIRLEEMEQVSLMNRFDLKYVVPGVMVLSILRKFHNNYRILEIGEKRQFTYHTTYLDSENYLFLNQHLTGKLHRDKIRFRTYESTGTTFLEVKRTTNKNKTNKWRIENLPDTHSVINETGLMFIDNYINIKSLALKPVLVNSFRRITLVSKDMKERVTIDNNISFETVDGMESELSSIAIIELKRERAGSRSVAAVVLKDFSFRPVGFSKYCMGASLLYNLPRMNVLKSKHLLINKIENEYRTTNYA